MINKKMMIFGNTNVGIRISLIDTAGQQQWSTTFFFEDRMTVIKSVIPDNEDGAWLSGYASNSTHDTPFLTRVNDYGYITYSGFINGVDIVHLVSGTSTSCNYVGYTLSQSLQNTVSRKFNINGVMTLNWKPLGQSVKPICINTESDVSIFLVGSSYIASVTSLQILNWQKNNTMLYSTGKPDTMPEKCVFTGDGNIAILFKSASSNEFFLATVNSMSGNLFKVSNVSIDNTVPVDISADDSGTHIYKFNDETKEFVIDHYDSITLQYANSEVFQLSNGATPQQVGMISSSNPFVCGKIARSTAFSCDSFMMGTGTTTNNITGIETNLDQVVLIICSSAAGVLLMIALLIYFIFRRKRKTKEGIPVVSYQIKSSYHNDSSKIIDVTTHKFGKTAVSIPGYLDVDYKTCCMPIKKVAEGGFGDVWYATARDAELIKRLNTVECAVKLFKGNILI